MNKYVVILIFFIFFISSNTVFCLFDKILNTGYLGQFSRNASSLLDRSLAKVSLEAGHQYSDQEKQAAREIVEKLQQEEADILFTDLGKGYVILNKLSEDNKKRLKEIEDEMYKQKLITGQEWSYRRKFLLGTIALMGIAALGYQAYKYAYQAPAPADLDDIGGLGKRLQKIEAQRYIRVPFLGYIKNPAFNEKDAVEALNQYKMAQKSLKAANMEIVRNTPYHSPDLVDPSDIVALKKRVDDIKKQDRVEIGGAYYSNPNFNREDLRVAEKQYDKALEIEGIRKKLSDIGSPISTWRDLEMIYSARKNNSEIQGLMHDLRITSVNYDLKGYTKQYWDSPGGQLESSQLLLEYLKSISQQRKLGLIYDPLGPIAIKNVVLEPAVSRSGSLIPHDGSQISNEKSWSQSAWNLLHEAVMGRSYYQ